MKSKVSIIMPAHNEEKRIGKTLEEYLKFFSELKKEKKTDFEIIVVLNACIDRTREIVEKYNHKYKGLKILDFEQGGKGFAIIKGFEDALKRNSDLIGFVDADLATKPESFYDLIENIKEKDGIIASRYIKGAIINPKPSIQRRIASRIFNFLIRSMLFMSYKDTQCGAKVFKREAIEKILLKIGITKWAFDVDMLYKLKKEKMKIKEHPTYWSDKEYSKINLSQAGPSMFLSIIRLRILDSWFKDFIRIYDKWSRK